MAGDAFSWFSALCIATATKEAHQRRCALRKTAADFSVPGPRSSRAVNYTRVSLFCLFRLPPCLALTLTLARLPDGGPPPFAGSGLLHLQADTVNVSAYSPD